MITESPEFWEVEESTYVYDWLFKHGCPVHDEHGDPGMETVLEVSWCAAPGCKHSSKQLSVFAFKRNMAKRPWAVVLDNFDSEETRGWVCTTVDEVEQLLIPMLDEKAPDAIATFGDGLVDMFPRLVAWTVARELNGET